jgi:hypothetical protein
MNMISAFSLSSLAAKYGQNLHEIFWWKSQINFSLTSFVFLLWLNLRYPWVVIWRYQVWQLRLNIINEIILLRIVYFRNFDETDTFYDELFLDKRIFYQNYFQEISRPDEYKVDHENPKQLFSYGCNKKKQVHKYVSIANSSCLTYNQLTWIL